MTSGELVKLKCGSIKDQTHLGVNRQDCAALTERETKLASGGRAVFRHPLLGSIGDDAVVRVAREFASDLEAAIARLEEGDAGEACRAVHAIITGAILFGHTALADACRRLEDAIVEDIDHAAAARELSVQLHAALRDHGETYEIVTRAQPVRQ